ncbi:putative response regulator receiver protein [Sphingobium sp. SYK-6]|uniref:PAS domain S-box protein n=1 Tax=Sphingobium sp. (strain NBRC 103272 / SYK-6) TaxID=627192 RepID=UPI000227719B|nr:PAS domain S-box protein [Sphingobium sp. SYK-6]BAK66401.1 putative response regulator receiver protein [Sphingobium sp. SYK-6]
MPRFDHESGLAEGPFITGSNALLAAIVHGAQHAIIGLDLGGIVLSWNDAAARLYGHSASEMIGRSFSRILPHHLRRDQEAVLARLREGQQPDRQETTHLAASGAEIPVSAAFSAVRDSGGVIVAAALIVAERPMHRSSRGDEWTYLLAAPSPVARNILVVEDEPLVGLGLAAMLENAGFDVIGPAGDVPTAMALLDRHECALALLDINLGDGETSAPLAGRLKEDDIPFFVMSGYLADVQPPIFSGAPSFSKPVRARSLVAAVQEVLG